MKPMIALLAGLFLTLMFAGILFAAGCTEDAVPGTSRHVKTPTVRYDTSGTAPYVDEFRLEDGTRCVASYKGGIDCEWRKP